MAKSKAVILQQVGEELGLVPIGQALEAQDNARISDAYDTVYEILKEKGAATWASTSVPTKLAHYVKLMIEEKLLTAFSVSEARNARIKAEAGDDGTLALAKLLRLAVEAYDSTSEPCDF